MRIGGVWVGWGLWDNSTTDFKVRDFKRWARPRFRYARGLDGFAETDPNSNLFDLPFQAIVVEMQRRLVLDGKLPAPLYPSGLLDELTQLAVGFLVKPPAQKPVIFTIEGHGSDMFVGPAYETARQLELQDVVQVQPIGYNNGLPVIPFDNQSGITELINQINRLIRPFPGRKFGVCSFSQGSIVWCRTYMEHFLPQNGVLNDLLPQLRRAAVFGNPCRQKGIIRPGMENPPPTDFRGIADVRISNTPSWWWEFAHAGDIYAAVPDNDTGEDMTSIYELVQGNFATGPNSILAQFWELFTNPAPELQAMFNAISNGVMFVGNMTPHGGYDIGPAIEHMRGVRL
jgi:hypothetical protein